MTSPSDSPSDPRVHCPRCGKRFRVDRKEVTEKPKGAPVRCSGCTHSFRIRLSVDDTVEVVQAAEPKDATEDVSASNGGEGTCRPKKRRARDPSSRRRRARPTGPTPDLPRGATRRLEPRPTFGSGERVGRYEVEALLGRGGMGAVYRVFDPAANRHVAMKVLGAQAPEADRVRFQREVEVQGNIQHPHIMPIYDSGTLGTSRYFTMELLKDPLSLSELVELARSGQAAKDPLLRPASTLEGLIRHIVLPMCQAVHHANVREAVLHRDIKPDNILVDRNGLRPFVIDFGVCSLLERKNARLSHLSPELPARLAGGGVRVTGTLLYMPPEQARGETDRRGDVWALGAVLHLVVTGAAPLAPASRGTASLAERVEGLELLIEQARRSGEGKEAARLRDKLATVRLGKNRGPEDLQRDVLAGNYLPRARGVAPALDAIVAKAMAVEPEARYRHALDLQEDLLAWLEGRPVRARLESWGWLQRGLYRGAVFLRNRRWAAALLVLALGAGAWAASGFVGASGNGQETAAAAACLVDAKAAEAAGDLATAERLAAAALGRNACADDARRLLERVGDRRRALGHREGLRRHARDAEQAFAQSRFVDGHLHVAALAALVQEGLLLPIEQAGTDADRAEVERFRALALGERRVLVDVPGGTARIRAASIDADDGRTDWRNVATFEDGAEVWVEYGPHVLGVDRGTGEVWWRVEVLPGDGPLSVTAPVDPGVVRKGAVHVPAGRAPGPTGEVAVEALTWERTEVTTDRYARFLASLPVAERLARVPRTAGVLGEDATPLWEVRDDEVAAPAGAAGRPVEGISLHDARAFAAHVGGRLPTAAEWAWAATGTDGRPCPIGDVRALSEEGVRIAAPGDGVADVGANRGDCSPFGVLDMAGNLAEFTRTLTTFRGTNGWLVMGGGYLTSRGRAIATEAEPVPGWRPQLGVGIRVVYDLPK